MVRVVGIEPTRLAALDFESSASTSFTTPAAQEGVIASLQKDFNPIFTIFESFFILEEEEQT